MAPRDVYTRKVISQASREHIIPNFLGGRLQVPAILDKSTNDGFGRGIDAELERSLRPLLNMIDARSHREPGRPAPTLRSVRATDGKRYHIEAGGKMAPFPDISVQPTPDGTHVRGSVATQGELRQALRNLARQRHLNLDELVETFWKTGQHRAGAPPTVELGLDLWNQGAYRAVAKIACNWLAAHEPELFLDSEFDPIRAFVLTGTPMPEPPVQALNLDVTSRGLGPVDHFVACDIFEDGRVLGVVVFFGVLAFAVGLGRLQRAVPRLRRTYRVDQLARSDRRDHPDNLTLTSESFESAAARPYEEYLSLVQSQLERLLPVLQNLQKRHWVDRVTRPHWDRLVARTPDGSDPSEEAKLDFASSVAAAFAAELEPRLRSAQGSAGDIDDE